MDGGAIRRSQNLLFFLGFFSFSLFPFLSHGALALALKVGKGKHHITAWRGAALGPELETSFFTTRQGWIG